MVAHQGRGALRFQLETLRVDRTAICLVHFLAEILRHLLAHCKTFGDARLALALIHLGENLPLPGVERRLHRALQRDIRNLARPLEGQRQRAGERHWLHASQNRG